MISLDPSKAVSIRMRRATQAIFKIIFKDAVEDPYPITGIPFRLLVQNAQDKNVITLAIGSGLTIGGAGNNELTVTITDVQSDMNPSIYFWKLMNDSAKLAWLNGDFTIHVGKTDAPDPEEVNVSISDTSDTIALTITSSLINDITGGTP